MLIDILLKLLNVLNWLIRIWFWKCLELTYICIMRDWSQCKIFNILSILTIVHLQRIGVWNWLPYLWFVLIWCRFLALIVFYHDVLELRKLIYVFLLMFPFLLIHPCKSTSIISNLNLLGRSTMTCCFARDNLWLESHFVDDHYVSYLLILKIILMNSLRINPNFIQMISTLPVNWSRIVWMFCLIVLSLNHFYSIFNFIYLRIFI